ncbi:MULTISPECIES: type II toxin-antitoxin system VapC family toxin [unclassified Devosia]|uniref:type II toxin-antitoxin system VapC family toxin n=1 Tax=unclassified Devosia TaxID=196773 RepID=UPI001AC5C67D|nr:MULTISPECIES: type II toxin-antitoxin system VapC family toxin [unclassified Devosia]MBN9307150.1 type II toxin-antitoxin system VapC family toxin [Devosia sp.]
MIVVDASVAVRWIAEEANAGSALTLLERGDLVAPDLLAVEVGNALRRKERNGELKHEQVVGGLQLVFSRVTLRPPTAESMIRAVEIAAALEHPVYDCLYVGLAEALGGRFVSHDVELLKRVRRGGFESLIGELPTE